MYCPRCDRTIKKERLEAINRELKGKFQVDALEKGTCPVCGSPLVDLTQTKRERR